MKTPVCICVDLDGTLVNTDMLYESFLYNIKKNPITIILVFFWILRGKSYLKSKLSENFNFDPAALPYNQSLLVWLKEQRSLGIELVLATASNIKIAQSISNYLGIFTAVVASDDKINLEGQAKGKLLVDLYGSKNFDYVGNSNVDFAVWDHCRTQICVESKLANKVSKRYTNSVILANKKNIFLPLIKALRPHQWSKNLIIFLPIILSHEIFYFNKLIPTLFAFFTFCGAASSAYLINDLFDLEADRKHKSKFNRPFASGTVSILTGLILAPLLLILSVFSALQINLEFTQILLLYLVTTLSYSWWLKKQPLMDVIILASLYTIRMLAGGLATGTIVSQWLFVFSMFLFLSLALIKRYSEFKSITNHGGISPGRGYSSDDLELISSMGTGAGSMATMVLALYVSSIEVTKLYSFPTLLWLICPIFFYWINRAWLIAHRDQMHEDPIVFALKDANSYVVIILCGTIMWLAR